MLVAYKLNISEFSKPQLIVEKIEFTRCFSGSLKFRDASGVQYVHELKHSNLEVFEVNDHVICICEEGQFENPAVYKALKNFHSKKIDEEIRRLKKIKNLL